MERLLINDVDLEFEVQGTGEPVLLVHGSVIAGAFAPLLAEPALTGRYRLITYHRRGYAGSSRTDQPVSIAQQAADARAVLRHVGVERAHIVGHSFGGVVALQLTLDAPELVHSLALLEPALVQMVPSAEQFFAAMGPILEAYQAGDKAAAIDGFLRGVLGSDYRSALDLVLPAGWFEQAVADADTFLQVDFPAVEGWEFSRELAGRIKQPVLAVVGAESAPVFVEVHELVQQWLPQAEPFLLPGATHSLQMQNPRGVAEALAGFIARHPLPVAA
jgi:pimeloyl-ACP methyl ester carboxylesterase